MSEPSLLNKAPEVASRKKLEGGQKFVLNSPFEPAGDQQLQSVNLFRDYLMVNKIKFYWVLLGLAKPLQWLKSLSRHSAQQ